MNDGETVEYDEAGIVGDERKKRKERNEGEKQREIEAL